MRIYIFEDLDYVSDRYHSEGGAVVIARDDQHMRELTRETPYLALSEEELNRVQIYELNGDYEPKVFIFPDAGCC